MLGTETVRALRAKGFKNTICGLFNDVEKSFVSAGADFLLKPIPCDRSRLEAVLDGILLSSDSVYRRFRVLILGAMIMYVLNARDP
jgi:hypothetical protein